MSQTSAVWVDAFPSTHWSLIDQGRDGLGVLFKRYRPAMLAYLLRAYRIDGHQAEDLVQGFAAELLVERDLVGKADRARGRFRSLLLTALDHFVLNQLRDARRAKRQPVAGMRGLSDATSLAGNGCDPVRAFESEWARQVVAEAIERTRRECLAAGRGDLWGIFEQRLLKPMLEGGDAPGYQQLIPVLDVPSPSQASNLLITGKRMFARLLREVVAEYTKDREEVEQEICELITILGR
jgi:RNA polymerase sigma-70 factor (ECF subfamily)